MKIIVLLTVVLLCAAVLYIGDRYVGDNREVRYIVLHATGGYACVDNQWKHFTGGNAKSIARHFVKNRRDVSIHYIIDRKGKIIPMLAPTKTAWHTFGHNRNSIGIELINNGDGVDKFPSVQIAVLKNLIRKLKSRFQLSGQYLYRHSDLDKRMVECGDRKYPRRVDPGKAFPFAQFQSDLAKQPSNE